MNFPITQFLREIDFGDSKSAKYAILTHLGVPIPIPNSGIPVFNSIPNSGIENGEIPVF